ncbi:ATP-binding cassette domain-containing protein [Kribbella sp. NPDC026596]|uniref:ATP-binding cassette domain-containing protein n=1 Tax=Kribbella sp. NPDC026596 TaxID=3155122 RepID=UPI0033FCB0A1
MPSWSSATTRGSSPRSRCPGGSDSTSRDCRRRALRTPVADVRADGRAPALIARDLVRTFGTRRVLDGVSLTASPGHRIGLIGENGVGKTTLLRLLAGPGHAGTQPGPRTTRLTPLPPTPHETGRRADRAPHLPPRHPHPWSAHSGSSRGAARRSLARLRPQRRRQVHAWTQPWVACLWANAAAWRWLC